MQISSHPTMDEQQKFWDWHWQHWQERKTINEWKLKRAEWILKMIASLPLERPKILDLGCGRGWFAGWLTRLGEVTGIDLSAEAIAGARSQFPKVNFIAADLYKYPLPAGYFDVVVSQEVISHVEDQVEYVSRANHALRPGGYFIVATGNKFVLDRLGDMGWEKQPPGHISRELNMRGLKRLLRSRFDILRTGTLLPMGQRGILRVINSYTVNAALETLIPRRYLDSAKEWAGLGYQMIVLAQKRP
jgi:2-polyprenyl-3-methyl-5-hydroxy-6-metoxy-1,4-benzoquinol methylase